MARKNAKPRYWLFQVMYDFLPESWEKMLKHGLAAQDYLEGWPNAARNRGKLDQLKKDDWILAALTRHRFAGYGRLASGFSDRGRSLGVPHPDGGTLSFKPRATCQWTAIPVELDRPYISCVDLGNKVQTRMTHGLCVREIDRASFLAIKARLDKEGARTQREIKQLEKAVGRDLRAMKDEEAPPPRSEGAKRQRLTNYYERSPDNRKAAIFHHGTGSTSKTPTAPGARTSSRSIIFGS